MVNSFEVSSVFKIINQASPALRAILKQVRELSAAIDQAKLGLSSIGRIPGINAATGQTQALAAEWRNVAAASAAATRSMTAAASAGRRGGGGAGGTLSNAGAIGAGPRFRGAHNAALAGAGLLGYGVYEEAKIQDAAFQLQYHAGLAGAATKKQFREVIQNAMSSSGFSLDEIVEAAKDEIRMFKGTPGGGIDVLPEMLRAATTEARLKGSSPAELMKALVGLAHMTKEYSPEQIKKLAPAFAFLSTANPSSLAGIERAAGYAVPILQSGLGIDPIRRCCWGQL